MDGGERDAGFGKKGENARMREKQRMKEKGKERKKKRKKEGRKERMKEGKNEKGKGGWPAITGCGRSWLELAGEGGQGSKPKQ